MHGQHALGLIPILVQQLPKAAIGISRKLRICVHDDKASLTLLLAPHNGVNILFVNATCILGVKMLD